MGPCLPLLLVTFGLSQLAVEQDQSDYREQNQKGGQEPGLISGRHHVVPADDLVPAMNEAAHFGLLWPGPPVARTKRTRTKSRRNEDQMRTRPEWLLTDTVTKMIVT